MNDADVFSENSTLGQAKKWNNYSLIIKHHLNALPNHDFESLILMLYQPIGIFQVHKETRPLRHSVDNFLSCGVFPGQTNQLVVDFVGKEVVEINEKFCIGF